jgi:hypothetical protein
MNQSIDTSNTNHVQIVTPNAPRYRNDNAADLSAIITTVDGHRPSSTTDAVSNDSLSTGPNSRSDSPSCVELVNNIPSSPSSSLPSTAAPDSAPDSVPSRKRKYDHDDGTVDSLVAAMYTRQQDIFTRSLVEETIQRQQDILQRMMDAAEEVQSGI